jgi:diguanylate cyclase (GGDEF)-like protein
MIFVLMFAILGELVTFTVIAPLYGLTIALLAAPGGGVLMALLAAVFLSTRHRTSSQPHSGGQTETARGADESSGGWRRAEEPIYVGDRRARSSSADFAFPNWLGIARWTLLGMLGCAAGAVVLSFLLVRSDDGALLSVGVLSSIVGIVVLITSPLLFVIAFERQELTNLRQKLSRRSSIDDLTLTLDEAVFSAVVDSFRGNAGAGNGPRQGAFLMIDIDNLNSINQRFGRAWGNEALRAVASAIKASVRSGDLVGRLGGEEFGVFLPGANRDNAAGVAERTRAAIAATLFQPGGKRCLLTVSVGAVVFEDQIEFDDLFRTADEVLLSAKKAGRNRTELTVI